MSKTTKTVKIDYHFNQLSATEWYAIYLWMIIICFIIAPTLASSLIGSGFAAQHSTWLYFELVSLVLPAIIYLIGYMIRKRERNRPMFIKRNGKKIIGTIVSLESIEYTNSGNPKYFSYTIEYDNPETGKKEILTTPSVLKDRMCVREEDLPIKVVMYVYGNDAFAEEIINPPIIKMNFRRFIKWLPIILFVIESIIIISKSSAEYEKVLEGYFRVGLVMASTFFVFVFFALGYDTINDPPSKKP